MSQFKKGDIVITVESRYLIGSPDKPIKTGTIGKVLQGTEYSNTIWVDFSGDKQLVYIDEIRLVTPLEQAMK